MQRRSLVRLAQSGVAAALLGLSGCGGKLGNFDTPDSGGAKPADPFGFGVSGGAAAAPDAPHIYCPEIVILEGSAAAQFHAGSPPSNANLRHQFSIGEVARECSVQGDQLLIKVGLSGNVLLGPAGAPGSFSIPLRVAIIRESDSKPAVSKLYRASATIGAGQTQAGYTIVTEMLGVPLLRPQADLDYSIKVGFDEGPGTEKPAGKHDK